MPSEQALRSQLPLTRPGITRKRGVAKLEANGEPSLGRAFAESEVSRRATVPCTYLEEMWPLAPPSDMKSINALVTLRAARDLLLAQ
jgi:hypothetical protein